MKKRPIRGRAKTINRWKARDGRKFNSPKWQDRARQPRRKGQKKTASDRRAMYEIQKILGFETPSLDIMFSARANKLRKIA